MSKANYKTQYRKSKIKSFNFTWACELCNYIATSKRQIELHLKMSHILHESEKLFAFNCLLSVFTRGIYKKENQEGVFVDTLEHGEIKIVRPISIENILYKRQIPTNSGEIISREKFFSTIHSFGFNFENVDQNTDESVIKLNNYLDSIRKFE